METKEVSITVHSSPGYEQQETEQMELLTSGILTVGDRAGHYDLSYQESLVSGLEGTTTSFKITPRRVLLVRSGTVSNQMLFEEGRQHNAHYATPYGSMQVTVCASRVKQTLTPEGGSLEIDYSMEIDHAMVGSNSLRIQVSLPRGGEKPLPA